VVQNARQGQAGRRDRAMLTLQTDAGFEQGYRVFAKIALRIFSLINIHGRKCGMLAAIQHVAAYADVSKEIHVSRLVGQTIADKRG
jgi:hypothetical protein